MNIACPDCRTVYRIDPARVPAGGALTRCRACGTRFRIAHAAAQAPGQVTTAEPLPQTPAGGARPAPTSALAGSEQTRPSAPVFGPQDPDTRARRLARALVSDIKVYNPDKWERGRRTGTLRREFREEILKSWDEYVQQVGSALAQRTPFFRDALNDILAEGERVF